MYKMSFIHRHFNKVILSSDKKHVIKSSDNTLEGEINYYLNIPEPLKYMFPKMIEYTNDMHCYTTEFIQGKTFSELFVNEKLKLHDFERMLKQLIQIHLVTPKYTDIDIYANYVTKLTNRYTQHIDIFNKLTDTNILYKHLTQQLSEYEKSKQGQLGMIHGDPVFTNIILCSNTGDIKFIDMRGKVGYVNTVYGDVAYDWAKVYQSLIGYDTIIYNKTPNKAYVSSFMDTFWFHCPFHKEDIKLITRSLVFTLLPLHSENLPELYKLLKVLE